MQISTTREQLIEALTAVKRWNDVSLIEEEWPVVMEMVNVALGDARCQCGHLASEHTTAPTPEFDSVGCVYCGCLYFSVGQTICIDEHGHQDIA